MDSNSPISDRDFWSIAARKGIPRFRWFRRSIRAEVLDRQFNGSHLEDDWQALKSRMLPGDQIWPFEFHVRRYLGMRKGYLVLREGKPLGGIVTIVS
ncbi:hypothetical protein [Aeoliella sp.]|uniref:hypothetical protein n=1 Tax=Aeoliella sp. TaxID=2795800 RepID=UPI003CCBAD22